MSETPSGRLRCVIRGAVQGVGFRPFVYRLASELGLRGWVSNSAQGVFMEAEGAISALQEMLRRLETDRPPRAVIQSFESWWLDPIGLGEFAIKESDSAGEKTVLVLPDIAMCEDCAREIHEPGNRRFRYPFTNCTNCGPRYSIIEALPYDRANTTMRGFEMCPACRQEYEDPHDRRFHAQPNACPVCGPHVELWSPDGSVLADTCAAMIAAAEAIGAGKIVAVKGLGGFQLIVAADDEAAVARLRARKRRDYKPLALMTPDLDWASRLCEVGDLEAKALRSPEAPIVLMRSRGGIIAPSVAPGNPYLGVMLPYTPLHGLLLRLVGQPVVATSGNLSDEPMCIDEREALARLGAVADLFLVHNRPILRHVDDSIVRVVAGRQMVLRRARGFAPLPVGYREAGDQGTGIRDRVSGVGYREAGDQGTGIRDRVSGVGYREAGDQGTGIRDQGAGPCPLERGLRRRSVEGGVLPEGYDEGTGIGDQGTGIRDQGADPSPLERGLRRRSVEGGVLPEGDDEGSGGRDQESGPSPLERGLRRRSVEGGVLPEGSDEGRGTRDEGTGIRDQESTVRSSFPDDTPPVRFAHRPLSRGDGPPAFESAPSTPARQPSTAAPQPSTPNPKPSTPDPRPSTLNPQPSPRPCILAVGAHLKNSVALTIGNQAFLSQHIGDLETTEALDAFERVAEDLARLYESEPDRVACDLHPDYLSTQYAVKSGLPLHRVQHHYAHVLACMADNDLEGPVLGVSWDGTGLGTDGSIWGGEFICVDRQGWERTAHLRNFRLPGGDRAAREPWRCALGLLHELGVAPGHRLIQQGAEPELRGVEAMLRSGVNCPTCSSAGRLFDAVAALIGLCDVSRFEGEGAMAVEFAVDDDDPQPAYEMAYESRQGGPSVLDWGPMIREILSDLEDRAPAACVAARFHSGLASGIVKVAQAVGEPKVLLTGGCFQNRRLLEWTVAALADAGFAPYWHQRIPPNDGGIAVGQAVAAARELPRS